MFAGLWPVSRAFLCVILEDFGVTDPLCSLVAYGDNGACGDDGMCCDSSILGCRLSMRDCIEPAEKELHIRV